MTRQLHFNLFLMPRGHHEGAWRHPDSTRRALTDLELYVEAARIAEAAKFDAVFLADALVAPNNGGLVASGSMEPITLLSALAARTDKIGLIGTASTTYSLPYTHARQFASLDHLSGGRAGWNIVTSWAPQAGLNYGLAQDVSHGDRYEIAEEFVEAVDALWRSFPSQAIRDNRETGQYLDPSLIQPANYNGTHFRTQGPLNVPSSPQGRPVYIQAGQSDSGRGFAARWAEAIFTAHLGKETAQSFYSDVKGRAVGYGRRPEDIVVLPGISAAIGSTTREAQQVWEELDALTSPQIGLARLSARFGGHDFSGIPLDRVLTQDDFPDPAQVEASKSRATGYVDLALKEGLTLRKLLQKLAGARGHFTATGTPEQVADIIEDWFKTGAADGFNVMPPIVNKQLELFATEVVPILRKRGLFRTDYEGSTLRSHFGLGPVGGKIPFARTA
ncbi:Nitrilotriacetate monooxygenase component A (plasmid) [Neorhizobium galegae bv. officinalis bv. officinalis str. HAMBI 1141]|uniref:Nitrilotriacetate monooxygenase component A n=1 Tax=Neorhizobium galegae bv. officinalis bv. officinalis str. HAMBI 1141 TaxID=1028801 RepID=A0A068THG6_NEOGA|nr:MULTISPECIES: LLM class flavin-dependent oxidoreductase [Neorhizobium]MCJ9669368.1 LLM class flavin-dependent oxidoreductase [Neorhizobium sp. SHOUNA12B]MCJ9745236.1 LLM class flavin-dependent oxidoreductase [Neorhizobium sp. SHOUNA12A]CDN57564.1 Nitrilotriacetate monooxygenase component A [Neorhizobium galegae bv. officinalis bv. officinalis str. HAMBI 1141]